MSVQKLESAIEAILFAAGDMVSLTKLAECIEHDVKTTKRILDRFIEKYNRSRGINIIEVGNSYQMCTNPDFFSYVGKLVKIEPKKVLTQTLLETLAIVAYKQPVTKSQIEQIRGVNADHAVNRLVEYGLVTEKGRQDTPGRPILFGTSDEFLKYFGFSSLSRLPVLETDYERLRLEAESEYTSLENI
jgi:segregation and condensation protein B